jgi:RES domain-containing protein
VRWWRIYQREFADPLSGEGARRYGGRWNDKGYPTLYFARSPALAMAEKLAQASVALHARSFVAAEVEIDARHLAAFSAADLPAGWDAEPTTAISRRFGHQQLYERGRLGFRIPSVVVPLEENAVLRIDHPDFSAHVHLIRDAIPFPFDRRLLSS